MNEEATKKTAAIPTGRRFSSVRELLKETDTPQTIVDEVNKLEKESHIVGVLVSLRQQAGLTQKELGEKIGLTQSAVSKLESSKDGELTFEDVRRYCEATGQRLSVHIGRPMNHVEAVKHHAFGIREHLSALAAMAHEDGEMNQAIQAFFGEAFFNILEILAKCQEKLPSDAAEIRIKKLEPLSRPRLVHTPEKETEEVPA